MNNLTDNNNEKVRAERKALNILGYRARSRAELARRLEGEGFSDSVISDVIEKMEGYGYINDAKFAADFVRSAIENKGYGRYRIIESLCGKGIDREIAASAFDAYIEEADLDGENCDPETEAAVKALKKRLAGSETPDFNERRKAYGFLMRRGFSGDVIQKAFKSLGQDYTM